MYGISGIKYQEKLEKLPLFNKKTAQILIGKTGNNLDKKIQRLLDKEYLINIKNGWYVSQPYINKIQNLEAYKEYLANQLRKPSYLSLEYVLSKYGLIPEAINSWTSITQKSTRQYENKFGNFIYQNIKKSLFYGYEKRMNSVYQIYEATKAKALFDFLYLKINLSENLEYELNEGLRINWGEFSAKDMLRISQYVKKADSKKMNTILSIIKQIKNAD